ncbi:MAG TPA: hypothetical protein VGM17_11030 [Rhizomicrobium sp.]|jgi:hypothetical protein
MICASCPGFTPNLEDDRVDLHAHTRGSAYRRVRDRLQPHVFALAPRVTAGFSLLQGASTAVALILMRLHWIFL